MQPNHILGMVCGYYLSKFDRVAYERLGHGTQQATHEALGAALSVPADSIKNWRDEFDPVHDNPRLGWHGRDMYPSRRRTIDAMGALTEGELFSLVRTILDDPSGAPAEQLVSVLGSSERGHESDDGSFGLRGPTGIKAEEAFARFHAEKGLPLDGELLDRRYEQCGFDFEIEGPRGRAYVEVKGLAGSSGGVTFTDKEWRTAQAAGNDYFLALVRNVVVEPWVTLVRNPAGRLEAKMRVYTTVQTGWSVTHAALTASEA